MVRWSIPNWIQTFLVEWFKVSIFYHSSKSLKSLQISIRGLLERLQQHVSLRYWRRRSRFCLDKIGIGLKILKFDRFSSTDFQPIKIMTVALSANQSPSIERQVENLPERRISSCRTLFVSQFQVFCIFWIIVSDSFWFGSCVSGILERFQPRQADICQYWRIYWRHILTPKIA